MKRLVLLIGILLQLSAAVQAQTERFDIATFTPPAGWERVEKNGTLGFMHSRTVNGASTVGQIVLYPSKASTGNVDQDFRSAWNSIVAVPTGSAAVPKIDKMKSLDGWDLRTGSAMITVSGITYNGALVTATGFGRTMSIQVNVIGGDHGATISKFFDRLTLNANAVAAAPGRTNAVGSLADYDLLAPPQWELRKEADHLRIQSPESGCLFIVFAPQRASGDLEQDAKAVFDTMYRGWQYQKAGEQRFTHSKGFTPQGLEFFMIEALMGKPSSDGSRYEGFEEGAALVIKAGAQIAIISVRHNSSLIAHEKCRLKYEYWRRFFSTFTVRNAVAASTTEDNSPTRIIGRWTMAESGGTGEYRFAANGNYALVGAIGTASTSSDQNYDYLYIRTYAFPGDGSYSVMGDRLSLRKRGGAAEEVRFRIDKVNHGGTGWKARLHMLKRDRLGDTESSYEKQGR